jgi:extracellular matrix regulatory protein A
MSSSRVRALPASEPRSAGLLRMLNVGYGNLVAAARVIAIVSPQSSPMRRLREEAGSRGKLVDATQGRRTRSILVTDSDHVILSAINPETIAARLEQGDEGAGEG